MKQDPRKEKAVRQNQAAQELPQRNRPLAVLNDLAVELASLPSSAVPLALARYLMATTGALAVSLARYDSKDRVIVPSHLEIEPGLMGVFLKLLGKRLTDVRSPVSEETYRRIVGNIVATVPTLTETTFGAIPPVVGAAIQKALGIDRFTGIAYVVEGELYGTSVMAMRRGTPDPPVDTLASFAHIAAVSLRRCVAEEALQESEEHFRVLAEQSPNMIFINKKGRIVYANKRCEEILGYTRDELSSPGFDFLSLYPPEWKDVVLSRFRKHMRGEEPGPIEYALVGKDGRRIEAIMATRLISYEGETAIFGTITDVTEIRRLQRQVLETAEGERRKIGGDMHDVLGQNLTGAGMLSEALARSLAGTAPSEAPKAVRITKLLYEATDQVRRLAKGLCPVDAAPEGLMKALGELASAASELFHISCRFQCAGTVLVHDGQLAEHLYRIAQESITNSVKHGGAKNVTIGLRSADGSLALSMRDDGRGFPDNTAGSAGLGLHIMRQRAGMMGGVLDIRNDPDGGAVILCSIPDASGGSP